MNFATHLGRNSGRATPSLRCTPKANHTNQRDPAGTTLIQSAKLFRQTEPALILDKSFNALPQLLKNKTELDFAYIDGWHTFDYTPVDFFYIDKMLKVRGIVAFNDVSWRSVHKVINFFWDTANIKKYTLVCRGNMGMGS